MKGLIYRELYLARKNYIFGAVSYLAFMLFGTLIRMSMDFGNLSKLSAENYSMLDAASYRIFTLLPSALLFFSLMGDGGVTVSDYASKWNVYACTLPVGEKKRAAVKFIIKAAAMAAALVLSIINAAAVCALCGKDLGLDTLRWIFAIMLIACCISCAAVPLLVKYRSSNAAALRITAVCIAAAVAGTIALKNSMNGFLEENASLGEEAASLLFADKLISKAEKARDILFAASPVIIAAAFALGMIFTVRFLKRREN